MMQQAAAAAATKTLDTEAAAGLTEADAVEHQCKVRMSTLRNVVSSYTFECGIIFHSKCPSYVSNGFITSAATAMRLTTHAWTAFALFGPSASIVLDATQE